MNQQKVKTKVSYSNANLPNQIEAAAPMWQENLYSLAGISLAMGVICFISVYFKVLYLIPSLASSAIMLFMSYNNAFAQPRNVVGGHLMAALAAVIVYQLFGPEWWAITIVVILTSLLMVVTHTIHPPGGGTAIAAFLGCYSPLILIISVLLGTVIIVLAALVINNAISSRKYPLFWI